MFNFFQNAGMQNHPLRILNDFLKWEEANKKANKYDDLRFVRYVLEIRYDIVIIITSDIFKLAHGIASLSMYPSAKILKIFSEAQGI